MLLRLDALERLAASKSDANAVEAGSREEQLPVQSGKDWDGHERAVTELFLVTRLAMTLRGRLVLCFASMSPEDKERALDLVQSVNERVKSAYPHLRDLSRGAAALDANASGVLAKATDPSTALREFFESLRKRLASRPGDNPNARGGPMFFNDDPIEERLKRLSPEQLRQLQETAKHQLLQEELDDAINKQRADLGAAIARRANGVQ
jgi:hypothetical protein